jgi:hypothetical protein
MNISFAAYPETVNVLVYRPSLGCRNQRSKGGYRYLGVVLEDYQTKRGMCICARGL